MNFIRDDGIKLQAFFTIYESDTGYTIAKLDLRTSSELLHYTMELDVWPSEHLD